MKAALEAGYVTDVFVAASAPEPLRTLASSAGDAGPSAVLVTAEVIAALSSTSTPQGLVAVASDPCVRLAGVAWDAGLIVVLAGVRDPGNAGTLVRCAAAAGADAVVFLKGSVDPLNPKTVRAAAGSLFQVSIVRAADLSECARRLRAAGFALVGADAHAPMPAADMDFTARIALVLGNEAWGLDPESAGVLDAHVRIPMPGPTESLNVSTAGAVLLYEAVRQRLSSASI